jgi:methylenetetrahydrofolate reductase (NADPH)
MKITDILSRHRPCFSFEFFPPKTEAGVEDLMEAATRLRSVAPAFVSVTDRAGEGTRARTLDVVRTIHSQLGLEVMAHLTCIGSTRRELYCVLTKLKEAGINNILALRGDRPSHEGAYEIERGEFRHASDLIRFVTSEFDFCVGAACYPEKHLESPDLARDLWALAVKVEAGASFLITQLFFDNTHFYNFIERARDSGIHVPIIPGIMPITNIDQAKRFTTMCGATIPEALLGELEARRMQANAVLNLGVAYATLQCADLLAVGVPGIHFYTLNRSPASHAVVSALLATRHSRHPRAEASASKSRGR